MRQCAECWDRQRGREWVLSAWGRVKMSRRRAQVLLLSKGRRPWAQDQPVAPLGRQRTERPRMGLSGSRIRFQLKLAVRPEVTVGEAPGPVMEARVLSQRGQG